MGRTQFENLRVYQLAEELADLCWKIVGMWNSFAQMTVGRQLVTAADSVGANIAEGSGRKSFADNKRFATIARGSLYELKHWLRRAYSRNLLTAEQILPLQTLINELTPRLNAYINSIGKQNNN